MTVQRISISLPAEVEAAIRVAAEAAGETLSAWITKAALMRAEEQAAITDGLAAVAEYEAEYGSIPRTLLDEADRVLDAAGIAVPPREERQAS